MLKTYTNKEELNTFSITKQEAIFMRLDYIQGKMDELMRDVYKLSRPTKEELYTALEREREHKRSMTMHSLNEENKNAQWFIDDQIEGARKMVIRLEFRTGIKKYKNKKTYNAEEIKESALCVDWIGDEPKIKTSRYNLYICPFHDDSKPSLSIKHDTNRYRCFGCDAHGDVIDLVMDLHNIDFRSACALLTNGS